MFESPEYASYIALCKSIPELQLPRNDPSWRQGDWCLGITSGVFSISGDYVKLAQELHPENGPPFQAPEEWYAAYSYELDIAGAESIVLTKLPRLDQWLAMLEEAGHDDIRLWQQFWGSEKSRYWITTSYSHYAQELSDIRAVSPGGKSHTREEAAARLWMAVTKAQAPPQEASARRTAP